MSSANSEQGAHVARRLLLAAVLGFSLMLFTGTTALAGGYREPTMTINPHGGYSDVTDKCKVCHAVHNAATTDPLDATRPAQALLRTSRGVPIINSAWETPNSGHPCIYCHVVGSWSITKVYGGVLANYTSDVRNNHDDAHRSLAPGSEVNYAGCISCHSVHGANLLPGYTADIVSRDPGPALPTSETATLTDFCRDCHEDQYVGPPDTYEGKYGTPCRFCHNTGPGGFTQGGTDGVDLVDNLPPFYTQARNGLSHVMTATLSGAYGTKVAWADTTDCRDCHKGGNGSVNNNFPHYTSGAQFLDDGYSTPDTGMDRVCLGCHVEGGYVSGYSTGVGKTF